MIRIRLSSTINYPFALLLILIPAIAFAQTYTVERVIDGDTIVVTTPEGKSEKVRLIGIDAPESRDNDKAKQDSKRTGQDLETINKMGQEATEFVKRWVKLGQEVRLEFDIQERDKYGRLLAYVYLKPIGWEKTPRWLYLGPEGGLFLNAVIISAGYATPMTIPPNVKYADLFEELYEEAREQKRGLWKDTLIDSFSVKLPDGRKFLITPNLSKFHESSNYWEEYTLEELKHHMKEKINSALENDTDVIIKDVIFERLHISLPGSRGGMAEYKIGDYAEVVEIKGVE